MKVYYIILIRGFIIKKNECKNNPKLNKVKNYLIWGLNFKIYNLITCEIVNNGNMYLDKTYITANKLKNENDNWLI